MVKNPHPPRSGGAGKKPADNPHATKKDDDAAKGKKKGGADAKDTSKAKGAKADTPQAPAEPPKPTAKQLIGGASWTGKLPVNLLSEHCQKQKWDKPDYTMSRSSDGYFSSVILRAKNPKTQEVTTLPPMRIPESHRHLEKQPTALEARHFAATWTLYRIANMKNIHMTLPPTYKDLWKGAFTDIKKEDVAAGKDGLYAADPFQARKDHESNIASREKKRDDIAKETKKREEQKESGAVLSDDKHFMRGWNSAPKVEMGRKMRRDVEALIKAQASWNPDGLNMSKQAQGQAVKDISAMGFRQSHVQEAVSICKDKEEALEWLLVHIPEDDLPKWSLPEGYAAGVSMASGDLKREAAVKRLAAGGYALELCQQAFEAAGSDEDRAAQDLQDKLLQSTIDEVLAEKIQMASLTDSTEEDVWSEEQTVLESIFEGKYRKISAEACEVKLNTKAQEQPVSVLIRRPTTGIYPNVLPVVQIHSAIPAYIRLSITRKALLHAADTLLQEQMIFSLVDWLENEIPAIVQDPGRLSDISAVSSTGSSAAPDAQTRQRAKRPKQHPKPISWVPGSGASKTLLTRWTDKQQLPAQQKMLAARRQLPAWDLQDAVVAAVQRYQVVIISGETGSGKSTQSVQFVLDDMIQRELGAVAKLICTQPRRISALGLADRVSDERTSQVGDEVGYAIRGESKQSANTKLTFCTTGVLLRRLQTSGGTTEDIMSSIADVSHIFVDEVHERSLDTDFLLTLLRDVLNKRSDLKVILMSATLDANIFEQYFGGPSRVGKVEIQGRTYPVQDLYLDDIVRATGYQGGRLESQDDSAGDQSVNKTIQSLGMGINYDLIAALVRHIDSSLGSQPGAILIFLPGTLEITRTLDALSRQSNLHALPLHASLLPAEQRRVFPTAPHGKRKVIASTNVAETSLTIPDVVAVIDSGRVKETNFDPVSSMLKLEEVWTSLAAGKQRRGRAGRVQAGVCWKLYTRAAESKMPARPDPEIRRVPLEQLALAVKGMGVADVASFLAGTLSPPDTAAVDGALTTLRRLGALDENTLTALGQSMALVPADLRCAKLMIYGALFGLLDSAVTIAAILTVRSPFVSPSSKRDEAKAARESFGAGIGDPIVDLRAFDAWRDLRSSASPREVRAWCDAHFLSNQTLSDISSTRTQYLSTLSEIGFLPPRAIDANRNAHSLPLLHALLASALHPHTLRVVYPPQRYTATATGSMAVDPAAKEIKLFTETNARAFIHPSSTLFSAQAFPSGAGPSAPFLSYWTMVATSKAFVRDVAPVGVFGLLLFAGQGVAIDELGRGVLVDGWVRVRGWARIGVLVGRLRGVVDAVLRGWVERGGGGGKEVDGIVGLVRRLVELDGLDA